MSEVPATGLAGYSFRILNSSNIAFTSFSSPLGLTARDVDIISAVDLNRDYEGGELDALLGTITFEARAVGPAFVLIDVVTLDDDLGFPIAAEFTAPKIEVIQ
jgi:hypothetical protein